MAPKPKFNEGDLIVELSPALVEQAMRISSSAPLVVENSAFTLHEHEQDILVTPTIPRNVSAGKKKKITIIHCWTAPRSRSTALLYSFEARGRTCVAIDEPLKREWLLHQGDKVDRPYKANMIAGVPLNPNANEKEKMLWDRETLSLEARLQDAILQLYKTMLDDEEDEGVVFCKHMSKTYFLYDFDQELTTVPGVPISKANGVDVVHKHMFLVRDPAAIIRSWDALRDVHGESCDTADVGIVPLMNIYMARQQKHMQYGCGSNSHITALDSDALVKDPEGVLQQTCHDLDISYRPSMMSWKAGDHDCDSRHAPWWYGAANESTGWLRAPKSGTSTGGNAKSVIQRKDSTSNDSPINPKLLPALHESTVAYEFLMQHSGKGAIVQ